MSKVVLYIATSLDGYIARENDDFSWLYTEGEFGYDEFIASIGSVVMGRRTYEVILGFNDWPYKLPTYVVTRQPNYSVSTPNTEVVSGDLAGLIERLRASTEGDIWLEGGGDLNAAFFDAGLVDEVRVFVHPVLLGSGLPLTGRLKADVWMELIETKVYDRGLLEIRYQVPH